MTFIGEKSTFTNAQKISPWPVCRPISQSNILGGEKSYETVTFFDFNSIKIYTFSIPLSHKSSKFEFPKYSKNRFTL